MIGACGSACDSSRLNTVLKEGMGVQKINPSPTTAGLDGHFRGSRIMHRKPSG